MGFLKDASAADPVAGLFNGAAGAAASIRAAEFQAQAGREAIQEQIDAASRAQGFFEPFAGVGQRGVDASGFLADPQAQFNFLQGNPLFASGLQQANRQTQAQAAARGRLGAGDTFQQLAQNPLLIAEPLLNRQTEDVTNLLNLGTGVAGAQANIETGQAAQIGDLTTSIGAAIAAGQVGAANAQAAGAQNALSAVTAGLDFFSSNRNRNNNNGGVAPGNRVSGQGFQGPFTGF